MAASPLFKAAPIPFRPRHLSSLVPILVVLVAAVATPRPEPPTTGSEGTSTSGIIPKEGSDTPESFQTGTWESSTGTGNDDSAFKPSPMYLDTSGDWKSDNGPHRVKGGHIVNTLASGDKEDKKDKVSKETPTENIPKASESPSSTVESARTLSSEPLIQKSGDELTLTRTTSMSSPTTSSPTSFPTSSSTISSPSTSSLENDPISSPSPLESSSEPPVPLESRAFAHRNENDKPDVKLANASDSSSDPTNNNVQNNTTNINNTNPNTTDPNTTNPTTPNPNISDLVTTTALPPDADPDNPYDDSSTGVLPIFTDAWASSGSRRREEASSRGLASPVRYSDSLGRPVFRSDEERLLDYLFREYNPSARPVINSSKSVQVSIQFSLMHFQELNVKSQILTSTGLLIMEWVDERLRWDPKEFNLNEIVISAKMLWVPEFAVINGAEEIYGDYREFRAIMTSDGNIRWEPGGVFKTMCEIDITYFPFDEQHCALVFGAWSYHTTKMNLTNSSSMINLDSYERNGEWEILSTKVTRDEFFYECCPKERFSNVAFQLHMRRRYTFYVMNVILPSMVTSILLLSIFYCPPGQKVQIGVVVLLSFRIFLLNVTDSIPKTSDHIPLLGIYLTCTMAITTLSMVLTVMVLNLHSISEKPVPRWVRIVVLRHLARLFCIGTDEVEASKKDEKANHVKKKRKGVGRMSATLVEDDGEEHMPIIAINGAVNAGQGQETSFVHMRSGSYANIRINNNTASFGEGTSASRKEEEKPDYSKDWHKLAEVVDRLFFWTFLLAIVAISILLFHPLTKNYLIPRPGQTPS